MKFDPRRFNFDFVCKLFSLVHTLLELRGAWFIFESASLVLRLTSANGVTLSHTRNVHMYVHAYNPNNPNKVTLTGMHSPRQMLV